MIYNLIDKKNNIKRAIPFEKGLVYSTLEDILFFNNTALINNIDGASIYRLSNNLIQIYDNTEGYYYLNKNLIKSKYFFNFGHNTKNIIATTQPERVSLGIYKKNVIFLNEDLVTIDKLILENVIENVVTYTNDLLFLGNKKIISAYSLASETFWQYDLSTKYNWQQRADYIDEPDVEKQAEVIKFLGVYKNELWLVLNSGALLALDTETGTESRYIKEGKMIVGESDFEDFKGYFGYDTVLDEERGLIFNLSRHFYLEYNLNSDNSYFDSYSFKESSQEHKLNLNYIGGFDEEYIYSYEGSDNNRFAIFSREKKEIIWSSEIEEVKGKFPAIRDLQYGAGKIYVLDHDNTLHIFEKGNVSDLWV